MKTRIQTVRLVAVAAAIIALNPLASAATFNWTGASGADTFWTTPGNWSAGGPPGDSDTAAFYDDGAAFDATTVNNIVSANHTIQSLVFGQTNGFHSTLTQPGVTLTLSGGLTVGTETDNGSSQTVYATIAGTGGALVINGGASNLVVRQGSAISSGHWATLDMSGLDTLTASVGRVLIGVPGINRPYGTLYLAKTNSLTVTGSTPAIDVGEANSNNGNGAHLILGQKNTIYADTITVARQKQTGCSLRFNPAFSNPTAYFRGADGVSRVTTWAIADGVGNSGTTAPRGTNDFSGGTVDALVDTMVLGKSSTAGSGANAANGMLTFTGGIMDVNTLQIGFQAAANGNYGIGTVNVNDAATLVVNSNLVLGYTTGGTGAATTVGTLNIAGGTVRTPQISIGAGSGATTLALSNGGQLILANAVGSPEAPLNTFAMTDSKLRVAVSGATANIVAVNLTADGTSNVIDIDALPIIVTYPVRMPLITYSSGAIGGAGFNFSLGTLPAQNPPYQGFLSNNTDNFSVDLVITDGPKPGALLNWSGAINGDWDTATANWLSSGTPALFTQATPVRFDDNAAGNTTINLATLLVPGGITVNNSAKHYIFTGSGRLTGTSGLTKQGSGSLLIENTGANDFIGGVTISGGTLQIGNGSTNGSLGLGSVTNDAALIFDRSDHITLGNVITGTGTITQMGSGTVTLNGSSSYSGPTVVHAGKLVVNGLLAGGGMLTNAPGTTLAGSGTNTGPVHTSGKITPGEVNAFGTLTAGELSLYSGAALSLDLSSDPYTVGTGINDLLEVNGNLTLNNNTLSVIPLTSPTLNAPYRLINYSGNRNGSFNPQVGGTHYTATLDYSVANQVNMTFSGSPSSVKWDSRANSTWDIGTTAHWKNLITGTSPDVFGTDDAVLFDDTVGVVTNVTIGAGIAIFSSAITNHSSLNQFTLSGAGKISGATTLVKDGTSTWILGTANDFTGTVTVRAGTLRIGIANALGTIDGDTTVNSGATLDINGINLGGEPITVSGAGVSGNGAIVNNGAQQISALRTVTLAGDTTFGGPNRWDIRNTGGAASLNTGGNPFKIIKVGTNQVSLVGVATIDFALGDIDIREGTFAVQTSTTQVGDPAKTITVSSNAVLGLYALSASPLNKVIVLNDGATVFNENGLSLIDGPITLRGSNTFNVTTAGTTPSLTVNNSLSGPGSLIKTGAGILYLKGVNSYSGNTVVNAGTLALTDTSVIDTSPNITVQGMLDLGARSDGTLTLLRGQTLNGNGTLAGSLIVSAGATVSPGAPVGALTVTNSVTLEGTTYVEIDKGNAANDLLRATTSITYGGTLNLTNLTGKLAGGDSFKLFDAPSYSGSFANIQPPTPGPAMVWDISSLIQDGTLKVISTAVPQPEIGRISLSSGNVLVSGTGGTAGASYYVLTSTNIVLPLANWTPLATNVFDANGNFAFTNAVNRSFPQQFFLLQLP
jgi:autotransporter-associated beta strand protein